jgi:hypothetical protein
MGGYGVKKEGQFLMKWPSKLRKEGYEERCLSYLFFRIVDKFFVSLTFIDRFTLSSTYFNMNLRTPFPFIANEVAHFEISPFGSDK